LLSKYADLSKCGVSKYATLAAIVTGLFEVADCGAWEV